MSKAYNEAVGVNAVGAFLQALAKKRVAAKERAQTLQDAETEYERKLAMERLKEANDNEKQKYSDFVDLNKEILAVNKAGVETTLFDPAGRPIGKVPASVTPDQAASTVDALRNAFQKRHGFDLTTAPSKSIMFDGQQPPAMPGVLPAYTPPELKPSAEGAKPSGGKGGAGGSSQLLRDLGKATAEYESLATSTEDSVKELDRIEKLNEKSYGGAMGSVALKANRLLNLGGKNDTYKNTVDTVGSLKALVAKTLKSTFTGAISDAEREYLQEVNGASETYNQTERAIAIRRVRDIFEKAVRAKKDAVDSLGATYGIVPTYKNRQKQPQKSLPSVATEAPGQEPVAVYERDSKGNLVRVK